MERYLLRLVLGIAIMSICTPVFSQVKLFDSGVTKFYEDGTRITYFKMENFPNSAEMREYVTKVVLENPDINRVAIYTNGKTFMYDALQRVEPDMVVDAVNEALSEYKAQVGDFPPNDPPSTGKPQSNVTVKPHKADVASQPAGSANHKSATEEKSAPKNGERQLDATPAEDVRPAKGVDKASHASNNKNSSNR